MRTACLLLALTWIAAAQPIHQIEAARARNLLGSTQWFEKAWGAYFAGGLQSDELKEPLIDALRQAASLRDATPGTEEHAYLTALLDAAIQSRIVVSTAVLEPFEDKWRAPAIVLLARDRGNEEALLNLRAQELTSEEWLALGNILLARQSQAFFARTLSEVKISHVFTLTDPGDGSGVGGGAGGGMCGDGVASMPKGFPPIALYELLNSPQPGDVLLAAGPEDVYYRRVVVPTDQQVGFGACGSVIVRQKIRIGYLARIAGRPEREVETLIQSQTRIEYRDEATLRNQWDAALSAQEAGLRKLLHTAQEQGWGSVAGAHLEIVPKLEDFRKTTGGPTPPLSPHEFVLE